MIQDPMENNFIRGMKVGRTEFRLSYLLYVDDVVVILDWCSNEVDNISRLLDGFYRLSGLN